MHGQTLCTGCRQRHHSIGRAGVWVGLRVAVGHFLHVVELVAEVLCMASYSAQDADSGTTALGMQERGAA